MKWEYICVLGCKDCDVMTKCACNKSGEPPELSLCHIDFYTKWKRRQPKIYNDGNAATPPEKRRKLTKKQEQAIDAAAAEAERAQSAKILDHNRVLTKTRFVVEATNQTSVNVSSDSQPKPTNTCELSKTISEQSHRSGTCSNGRKQMALRTRAR